jgi:hypothetical protein
MVEPRNGGTSFRVRFPHPLTGWDPPAEETFADRDAAVAFDELWKRRKKVGRLGEVWAELATLKQQQEAQADLASETVLLGNYLIDGFFEHWKRTPGRGRSGPKSAETVRMSRDWLMDHVYDASYQRNVRGHALRDAKTGARIVTAWGHEAIAWLPLKEFDAADALAFDARLEAKGVGREVRRKVLSLLQQAFDHAVIVYPELYGRPNPFSYVKKPAQGGVKTVRGFKPDVVEIMRADWQILETLARLRVAGRLKRAEAKKLRALGWPVPETPFLAAFTRAFISAFAYSSARPQELLAASLTAVDKQRLNVVRHNVNGKLLPGTKSTRYPTKRPLLIGPGAADLAAWRVELNANLSVHSMLLLPNEHGQPWNTNGYRNWRSRSYGPVALRNGLANPDPADPDADDSDGSPNPYALRHVYATLRLAAHHDAFQVERSMGTSLVTSVYADLIEEYEEGGVLDIDAEVARARAAAGAISAANFRRDGRAAGLDYGLVEAVIGQLDSAAA